MIISIKNMKKYDFLEKPIDKNDIKCYDYNADAISYNKKMNK